MVGKLKTILVTVMKVSGEEIVKVCVPRGSVLSQTDVIIVYFSTLCDFHFCLSASLIK